MTIRGLLRSTSNRSTRGSTSPVFMILHVIIDGTNSGLLGFCHGWSGSMLVSFLCVFLFGSSSSTLVVVVVMVVFVFVFLPFCQSD